MSAASPERLTGTVRLQGLSGRPELNGKIGVIELYNEPKGRYAVRLLDGVGTMLFKLSNLEPIIDGAYVASDLKLQEGYEARQNAVRALVEKAKAQHALKEEASQYVAVITAAKSRAEVPDDVWDRVVEIQRIVQTTCQACNEGFPAVMDEALRNDDAPCWSRAAIEFAHYLLGQPEVPDAECTPMEKAKRLAGNVLKLHACNGRCRDAMLAAAVLGAEGPFSRTAAEELQSTAPDMCPLLDGSAWALRKERESMHRELRQPQWDTEKHERLAQKGAAMAADLLGGGVGKGRGEHGEHRPD